MHAAEMRDGHADEPQYRPGHERGRRRGDARARLPGHRHRSLRRLRPGFLRGGEPAASPGFRGCASTPSGCGPIPTRHSWREAAGAPSRPCRTRRCRRSWACSSAWTARSRSRGNWPRASARRPAADLNIGLTSLPSGYTVIPNPDLQPESSRGAEAGARYRSGPVRGDGHGLLHPLLGPHRVAGGAALPGRSALRAGRHRAPSSRRTSRPRASTASRRRPRGGSPPAGLCARAFAIPRGDDIGKDAPLNSIDPPRLVAGIGYEARAPGVRALHVDPRGGADAGGQRRPASPSCRPRGPRRTSPRG